MAGLLAFLGALLGAAIPGAIALRGQRQAARTEWRQRLDQAITALTSEDLTNREIGRELLAELIESDLGSDEDRELARRISRAALTGGLVDEAAEPDQNGPNEQERR